MPIQAVHAPTAPRYTSYPTAPHFHAGIQDRDVREWMAGADPAQPISLYIHVPFCDRLCWFCACHTRHTLRYDPVAEYVGVLEREIDLVAAILPHGIKLGALHLGGGSPTMLRPEDLERLMDRLARRFGFAESAEISVEIDPNDIGPAKLDALASVGMTRASLGVQDFEPKVQAAINREQSFDCTRQVVEGLRERGVRSINLDLVYGLPHQTVDSVATTLEQSLLLRPDRIAFFGYAHVPWFKKHQAMIDESVLPGPDERRAQAERASAMALAAGYQAIGIDHFALPGDSLSVAAAEGRLRRNFQGYTDDRCKTLIGLGPSSVSRFSQGYAQNTTMMGHYARAIEAGRLPVARGIALSPDDQMRAWVIERLMCDFALHTDELAERFGDASADIIGECEQVSRHEPDRLARNGPRFEIPPESRVLTRLVAAQFDAYLSKGTARHSSVY